ncbi:MAG: gamma-glutamyltransferase [Burkholderiaceae bacterium]|jgi:gamma-glutamyltranspeptidase/glutathione hydrolase|nr:gamma-glutamyltransferase [Burkholderiaceae bacterium]
MRIKLIASNALHPPARAIARGAIDAAAHVATATATARATVTAATAAAIAAVFLLTAFPAEARAPAQTQQTRQSQQPRQSQQRPLLSAAAVAVADRYGADAAQRILAEGGNAVDAAAAIAFTLAVTYPEAGNIGGGGFMTLVVHGKPYFLDYRERAPLAAQRTMYLDAQGEVIAKKSRVGPLAAGVPGTVAGMWQAQRRFGRLPWKQVLAPAIGYARAGFVPDALLIQRRDAFQKQFDGQTNFDAYFGAMKVGVNFKQPELAHVLERIARDGERGFYRGETAQSIIATLRSSDDRDLITAADLSQYKAVWRAPIEAQWKGYRVITAPPPSSGGVGLVQMLKMKADLAPQFEGVPLNSARYIHRIAEIEKRVFADRAQYLGDPDFYPVPLALLIDEAYLQKRAAEVNPDTPSDVARVQPGLAGLAGLGVAPPQGLPRPASAQEKPQTTHFSVVDQWGNAVANTYTLNGYFGAGVVVKGAGFLLNNEMDDFSAKPGVANMFGVVGNEANAIAPGKRPLSSMAPTILTRDGKVALVIGTPGGSRIFTTIFQVITNVADFHMPLADAVAAMRFHHQLLPPNTLFWEPYQPIDGELAKALQAQGYVLHQQGFNGDVQAIQINGNRPEPVTDPRGRGVARLMR